MHASSPDAILGQVLYALRQEAAFQNEQADLPSILTVGVARVTFAAQLERIVADAEAARCDLVGSTR